MKRFVVVPAVAMVLFSAASAQAQIIDRVRQGIEKGLDRAVQGVAKRYNLDDQQAAAARKLFNERANDFLDKNGERIEKLVAEVKDRVQSGQLRFPPRPEDIKEALELVMPLVNDARKHFGETADHFRGILNDDQRKTFDEDRARLEMVADQALESLKNGQLPLGALGGGLGGFGGGGDPAAARTRMVFTGAGFLEREWDLWLERSAKAAKMTDEQFSKSREILKLAKEAAAEYRRAKEEDIKRVGQLLRDARRDAEKRKEADKAAEELAKPLEEIGKKWQSDVLALLSEEQRKAAIDANRRPGQ
jgi:hypothetical protein